MVARTSNLPARSDRPTSRQPIGRDSERTAFHAALAAAGEGRPQVVWVSGEAGSGKTFFLKSMLGDGRRLLWGDCSEFAASEFGSIKDMLRRLRREDPMAFDACREAHPILSMLLPPAPAAALPASADSLAEALAQLLLHVSGLGLTTLVFDDLHNADHATVDVLAQLRDQLSDQRVVLVCAHRSEDLPRAHPLRRLRQRWRRAGGLIELELAALDPAQSFALVATRLGADPAPVLAAELLRLSGGLPLYLGELIEALQQRDALQASPDGIACSAEATLDFPQSLRDSVLLRLAALAPAAQRLLERAAVMGSEVDLELLCTEGDDGTLVEALYEAGWLHDAEPGQARFRHALLREAVYGQIPWTRRRQWHAHCAAALAAAGRSLDSVCEHWLAAREFEPARLALLARMQRALRVHAHADAARHVTRALELWPDGVAELQRLDALYQLGDCAQLARRPDEAARAWTELCERGERAADWQRVGPARRRLAVLWALTGEVERGVVEREAAAAAFLAAGCRREAALELCAAADALTLKARWSAVLDLVAKTLPLAVAAEDADLIVLLRSQRGRALARSGRVAAGLAEARAALDLAEASGLVAVIGIAYQRLADCHEHGGDYARARDLFLGGADWCASNGQGRQREACRACALPVLIQNGEWPLATTLADEIAADVLSPPWARVMGVALGAQLQGLRGGWRSARSRLQQGLAAARQIGFTTVETVMLGCLALCDDAEGRPLAALANGHAALKVWHEGEEIHHIVPTARLLATLFAEHGDAAGLAACVAAASVAAQGSGHAEALAGLAFTLGESALLDGRPAEAVREFASALELGHELPLPLARATTLRRLAEAETRSADNGAAGEHRRAAGEHLRGAIDAFAQLDATPFLTEATERLRALSPAALTPTDERRRAAGLTPRQLQILGLVAQGASDKQIARTLSLSPRTVEMHTGRVLATLRCRNRAEAVARAGELGLLAARSGAAQALP